MSASSGERYDKATRGQRGRGRQRRARGGDAAGRRDGAFSPNRDDPDHDRRPENSRETSRGYGGRCGRRRGARARARGYGRTDSGQQASWSVEREAGARTPEGGRDDHSEWYRGRGRSSYGSRGRGRGAGARYMRDRGRGNSLPPNARGHFRSVSLDTAGRRYLFSTPANIKSLSTLHSEKLAEKIDSQLKEFQEAIGNPQILGKSGDVMDAVIAILLELTELARGSGGACAVSPDAQRAASRIVAEILSERTEKFHFQLQRAVKSSTAIQARRFCDLFLAMLTTFESSAWSCLPIDDLHESAERLTKGNLHSELLKLSQELLEARDRIRNAHTSDKFNNTDEKKVSDDEWDDSKFRSLPLLPEWKEINKDNGIPPEVRRNKVEGRYKDWTQYYDIQFRLIREDFIAPLRRGITAYLHGEKGKKNRDVKTYSDATISSQVTTRDKGICFNVQFDVSGFRRVKYNWDHSKRLIFGSLLCFIPSHKSGGDSLFATVADRDSKELTKGMFMVQFEDALAAISHCIQKTNFEIVESNSYYEATRPILRSIQRAEDKTMPFTKELIEGECGSVLPPVYLRNTEKKYNLSCLNGSVKKRQRKPPLVVQVLNKDSWSAASNSELDSSQLNAIQTALTREIAVIQGPPGTGKTYIGLKIVEALLENRQVWDPSKTSPILVMCFTNHALDQFLEGIIDTQCCGKKPRVIRVGGRCKSEKVDEYNLNKVRRNAPRHRDDGFTQEIGQLRGELEDCNPERLWKKVRNAVWNANLLPVDIIRHVAHPDHFYQLTQMAACPAHKDKEVEVWLGLWEQDSNKKEKTNKAVSPERKEHNDTQKIDTQKTKAQQMHTQDNQDEHNDTPKLDTQKTRAQQMHTHDNQDERNDTPKIDTQKTKEQQMHTQDNQDEGIEGEELLITIEGEATLAQEERMLGGDAEGFERVVVEEDDEQHTVSHEPLNEEHSSSSDDDSDEEKASQRKHRGDYSDFKQKKKKKPRKPTWCRKANADNVIRRHLFKNPMEDEEADEIEDICQLNNSDRWRLYNYWAEKRHDFLREDNRAEVEKYNELCRELADLRQLEDRFILEKSDVIGMTTTGAAKYQHILHHIKPRIVIVEEAAEVLEAHIVSALSAGTQHLILIGDHKQLRPKPNEYVLATKYNLAVSLFERLVNKNLSQATLEIQHRMRPDIARLVCPHVYDRLLNHESVEKYPEVKGISKNLFFVHHTQPESENPNLLSYVNEFEAKYIVSLCAHLLSLGYSPSQITVLTPYVGQLLKLRDKMPRDQFEGVRVTAIDNFQGEENDIILFSMVRSTSDRSQRATIGFLKEDNRVCVSLSRAKHGFYAIGNFQLIRQQSILWESIISDVEERGCFGDALPLYCCNHPDTTYAAKNASDFKTYAPKGGCQVDCDIRLSCGHVCTQKCHVTDIEHKNFRCLKLCVRRDRYDHQCKPKHACYNKCPPCYKIVQKVMPGCGHKQEMKCCEDLPCYEIVTKVMPGCGHEQGVPCSVDPEKWICKAPCPKSCEKGHPCPKCCYERCSRCIVIVEKEIPVCKHKQMMQCYRDPVHFMCQTPCHKYCENGLHQCPKACSEKCGKCEVHVQKKFPECGHTNTLPCWVEPNPTMCQAECQKLCPNEQHTLRKFCNQEWLPCKRKVTKTVPTCGHSITVPCFQDPSKTLCTNPCEKSCKEGHRCQKLCHEECGPCSVMVQKELFCGHTHSMECSTNRFTFKCPMQCLKPYAVCENSHKCKKQCHYPLLCKPCDETVQKIMPLCAHEESIPCHMSADPQKHGYSCKHPCEKKLECGHMCLRKCGESCQIMCTKKVTIKLLCGHTVKIECYKKNQNETLVINCKEKVNVKIMCGHTAKTECWRAKYKTLLKEECSLSCKKVLECGHVCQEVCSKPCTTPCKIIVKKRWPCGHELKRKCFQTKNMEKYPCDDRCFRKLTCGHWCTNSCGEPCSTCRKKSSRKYPCGHSAKIPCNSTAEEYPCKKNCTVELSCGHRCSGKCGDCYSSCMHAICIYDVKVFHYYGHSETVPCAGLSQLCRQEQQFPCFPSHGGDYTKCHEPCRWDCPHFHCTNECREECNRQPCNQPCKKRLTCGHQCPGVCGEPCLSVCPECNPVKFEKKLHREKRKRGRPPTGQMYIELGCGHVFNVEFLDTYMDPKVKTVMPKQCPKCHQNIAAAFRYGNAAKRSLRDVMDVDDIVKQYISIPEFERQVLAVSIRELKAMMVSEASWYIHTIATKLSSDEPVTQEENCFIHCLISYSRLYCIVQSQARTLSDLKDIVRHLKISVNRLIKSTENDIHSISGYDHASHYMASDIIPKRNLATLHLSWQLLKDFKSELYRLALCAQCIIVKDQQTIAGSAIRRTKSADALATIDTYLHSLDPLIHRISEEDYEKYSGLIKEAFPGATAIHVQTLPLPPVIKGTWTKCPNGHYYCKPPMRGSGAKPLGQCPQCQ